VEENLHTPFSKAILTSLFCGIAGTLSCFAFAISYRIVSGYNPTSFINVSALIFGCNILMLCFGAIYFEVEKFVPKGRVIFEIALITLTIFCLWRIQYVKRSSIAEVADKFKFLLSGIVIILGIYASVLLPFLSGNKRFLNLMI